MSRISLVARAALVLLAASCMDANKATSPDASTAPQPLVLPNGMFNAAATPSAPASLVSSSVVGGAASFATATGTNVIVNGDFASGSLTGWSTFASNTCGSWRTYTGTSSQSGQSIAAPAAPPAALLDMGCAAWYAMYQTVTVPASGQLSFDLYLANRNNAFVNGTISSCCTQMFRADITTTSAALDDDGAGVLKNIYATKPGDAAVSGYTHITADLTSLAGQTVRLRFSAGVWDFFFEVGIDNVALVAGTNTAPTASLPATYSATEGTPVLVSATAADVDGDALTYKWDINNDGIVDSTNTTGKLNLTFADNGSYPVKVTVDDGHGNTTSASTTVTVANAAPVISTINAATSLPVGGTFTLAGTFTDAGANDGPWTATVDWGDHSSVTLTLNALGAFGATHSYATFGSATVSVTIKDKDGGVSSASTVALTTTDATAPVIVPTVTGASTVAGWYTGNVTVDWAVTDPESGVATKTNCDEVVVSANTTATGTVYTCSATNGAGLTATNSVTVKRDDTAPTVTPVLNGPFNAVTGWYTGDVSVSWAATPNGPSGATASTSCNVQTLTTDTQGTTYSCTATSGAGKATTATVTVKRDATIPTVTGAATGTKGANDWFIDNATVHFTVSQPGISGITTAGCADAVQSTDTQSAAYKCVATTGAGISSFYTVTLKRDASAPVLTPSVSGTLGNEGWYRSDVTVSWSASDPTSGVDAVPCAASTLGSDNAGTTYGCTATNGAGLKTTLSQTVKRDATPPTVTYAGNASVYTVDQTVAITCSATDAMSGVATNSCANVNGAAYSFAIGSANTYTASATDHAGNSTTASTSFTVQVSDASVCSLVKQFSSNAGVATALCAKLVKGNYDPFRNELAAQAGKKISTTDAATLLRLVNILDAQ